MPVVPERISVPPRAGQVNPAEWLRGDKKWAFQHPGDRIIRPLPPPQEYPVPCYRVSREQEHQLRL
eukprot:1040131-Karenia_brevis.AAC.1